MRAGDGRAHGIGGERDASIAVAANALQAGLASRCSRSRRRCGRSSQSNRIVAMRTRNGRATRRGGIGDTTVTMRTGAFEFLGDAHASSSFPGYAPPHRKRWCRDMGHAGFRKKPCERQPFPSSYPAIYRQITCRYGGCPVLYWRLLRRNSVRGGLIGPGHGRSAWAGRWPRCPDIRRCRRAGCSS